MLCLPELVNENLPVRLNLRRSAFLARSSFRGSGEPIRILELSIPGFELRALPPLALDALLPAEPSYALLVLESRL